MSIWGFVLLGVVVGVVVTPLERLYKKHYADDETAGFLAVAGIFTAAGLVLAVVAGISYVVFDW